MIRLALAASLMFVLCGFIFYSGTTTPPPPALTQQGCGTYLANNGNAFFLSNSGNFFGQGC